MSRFKNSLMSFDPPEGWECEQQSTAWICTPPTGSTAKDALITLTAKVRAPHDTLDAFRDYLKKTRVVRDRDGLPVEATIYHVKDRNIGGHLWIESLQLNSEIPNYFTLYLITVQKDTAILINFSAEQSRANTYNAAFTKSVESIRLARADEPLAKYQPGEPRADLGIDPHSTIMEISQPPPSARTSYDVQGWWVGAALLIAILTGFIALYLRRKK